jgi:hypothetical protein
VAAAGLGSRIRVDAQLQTLAVDVVRQRAGIDYREAARSSTSGSWLACTSDMWCGIDHRRGLSHLPALDGNACSERYTGTAAADDNLD